MDRKLLLAATLAALAVAVWLLLRPGTAGSDAPIKVGVLHSLTGTMAMSEKAVVDATLMAIEELNEGGGLLGRKVEAVVADGRSDWPTFAREAERLITQQKVSVVFGCWTSASRKTVKPVFERLGHLLFYPVQYEGLEQSPNIVYTGAAPNQQIIPAVKWAFDNLGKRFFLAASDYVFPRASNEIIRDQSTALGAQIVGEHYVPLGSRKVQRLVQKIVEAQPDVILNTINGDTNVAFFKALRRAGITPARIPTMSFSVAENELKTMGAADMVGDYAAWNYFQSLRSAENKRFVARFKRRNGDHRVTNDPMEAAYLGVHLWARAVREAQTVKVAMVRAALSDQTFRAPEGMVYVDANTNHTWKRARIGRIKKDGQFRIVWSSQKPIQPVPYPASRSRIAWDDFLGGLYRGWGQRWASPKKD